MSWFDYTPLGAVDSLAGNPIENWATQKPDQSKYALNGFEDRKAGLNSAIGQAGGALAPNAQAAQIGQFQNAGMGGQFRGGQQQLIGQLQQQANGQGPSLATSQFNQALDAGMASQFAQANTGRGNGALAGRMAAQNIGTMTQGMAGQAAQARMQEQMQAREQLAGVLGQARGQEMQGGQFNAGQQNQRTLGQAGFQQDANLANQNAWLQNQGQQNQYGLSLRDLELRNAQLQQQGLSAMAGQPTHMDQLISGGTSLLGTAFGAG